MGAISDIIKRATSSECRLEYSLSTIIGATKINGISYVGVFYINELNQRLISNYYFDTHSEDDYIIEEGWVSGSIHNITLRPATDDEIFNWQTRMRNTYDYKIDTREQILGLPNINDKKIIVNL